MRCRGRRPLWRTAVAARLRGTEARRDDTVLLRRSVASGDAAACAVAVPSGRQACSAAPRGCGLRLAGASWLGLLRVVSLRGAAGAGRWC
ncbi:hypothetical protein [Amycolatopsis plumensis]|uniref:hypothetical protein n=1 Tax=Amycolatopsis plumensis TaxID=236508 RepID=UPI0036119D71